MQQVSKYGVHIVLARCRAATVKLIIYWLLTRKLTCNYFDNKFIVLSGKMLKVVLFQLLKCEELQISLFLYHCKVNIFKFWNLMYIFNQILAD